MQFDLLESRYPSSSWVAAFGFGVWGKGKRGQGIVVLFWDGFCCGYPGTDEADYAAMRSARSKGKHIHAYLYDLPYIELDGESFGVTGFDYQ